MEKAKNKRYIIWVGAFAALALAIALYAFFIMPKPYPKDCMILDVTITDITIPEDGSAPVLTVHNGADINGILLQKDTRFFMQDGTRIKITDLKVGCQIQATVGPDVYYEPYDTYFRCYEIIVM